MLGHLIYNHQHLDDCRIQQEISKGLYAKRFGGIHLVHAYNGDPAFGCKPYLEDKFIKIKNRGHFQGAVDLINAGVRYLQAKAPKAVRYVLVTAADTWVLNINWLAELLDEMRRDGKLLAASSWGSAKYPQKPSDLSVDFFILDLAWNRQAKLWPLDYQRFVRRFADLYYLQWAQPVVEVAQQYYFMRYFADRFPDNEIWRQRNKAFRRIIEREPVHDVHGERPNAWPQIGLYTAPDRPTEKQVALRQRGYDFGPNMHRLLTSMNLSYYNSVTS